MNFKKRTPFIRRIPTSGGQFYTFQSSAEDLSLNINESSDRKFRFSKFALLNIPKLEKGNGTENTFKLDATIGGYSRYNLGLSNDINIHFADSFQNYCLNLETMILADPNYKQDLANTVSERVFFKWLKEHSVIRFREATNINGIDDVRFFEQTPLENDYNKVVRFIGDVDLSGNIYSGNATYTEVLMNISSECGSAESVLFKVTEDENYYPGKSFFRIDDGLNNEIIYGRNYDDLHPDKLDIRAHYDIDITKNEDAVDLETYLSESGIKLLKRKDFVASTNINANSQYPASYDGNKWWFSGIAGQNGYILDSEFTDYSDDYLAILNGGIDITEADQAATKFVRTRLDGIGIDFDLNNYKKIYDYKNINSLHDLGRTVEAENFDFNAVLLYYDVYNNSPIEDENGNVTYIQNTLATNLFGVLFLDDVTSYSNSGGEIKPFSKFRANETLDLNGNEFSFKINLRLDINNPLDVIATSSTLKDYVVNENNTLAMNLFFESLQEMVKVSSHIESNEFRFLEQETRLRNLEQNKSNNLIDNRITVLENKVFATQNTTNIDYNTQIQSLYKLFDDLSSKYYNLISNKTDINVNVDLGNIQAGSGIDIIKNNEIVTLNSKSNYFNYSDKPIITQNDFVIKSLKNSNNKYLTYEFDLVDGNNYIRFMNTDSTVYTPQYDIIFYIKDDKVDWKKGQMVRFFFDSQFDLFSNGTNRNIIFITDYKNKLKTQENYSKVIRSLNYLDGIGYNKKIPSVEIHCVNNNKFEFFVDTF